MRETKKMRSSHTYGMDDGAKYTRSQMRDPLSMQSPEYRVSSHAAKMPVAILCSIPSKLLRDSVLTVAHGAAHGAFGSRRIMRRLLVPVAIMRRSWIIIRHVPRFSFHLVQNPPVHLTPLNSLFHQAPLQQSASSQRSSRIWKNKSKIKNKKRTKLSPLTNEPPTVKPTEDLPQSANKQTSYCETHWTLISHYMLSS